MNKIQPFQSSRVRLSFPKRKLRYKANSLSLSNLNALQCRYISPGSHNVMYEAVSKKCELVENSDQIEDQIISRYVINQNELNIDDSRNFNPWNTLLKQFKYYKSTIPSPDHIRENNFSKFSMPNNLNSIPQLNGRSLIELANAQKTLYAMSKKLTLEKPFLIQYLQSDPNHLVSFIERLINDQAISVAMMIYLDLTIHYHEDYPELVYRCHKHLTDLVLDGYALRNKMQSTALLWDYFNCLHPDTQYSKSKLNSKVLKGLTNLDLIQISSNCLSSGIVNPDKLTNLSNRLLHCLKKVENYEDFFKFYELMQQHGIQPDVRTLTTILDSCINAENTSRFITTFKTLQRVIPIEAVTTPTFTTLLKSMMKLNLPGKFRYQMLDYLKQKDWRPNKLTAFVVYPLLRKYPTGQLNSYLRKTIVPLINKDHPYVRNVEFNHLLIQNPLNPWLFEKESSKKLDRILELEPRQIESITRNLAHNSHIDTSNKLFDHTLSNLSQDYSPSLPILTKLIHTNLKDGKYLKANYYIDSITRYNYTSSYATHYALLNGLFMTGNLKEFKKIFNELVSSGSQVNSYLLGQVIKVHLTESNLSLASYYFQQFFEKGMIPSVFVYNTLIKHAFDLRNLNFVAVLTKSMLDYGVNFNSHTYFTLIRGYFICGDQMRACDIYQELLKHEAPLHPQLSEFIIANWSTFSPIEKNYRSKLNENMTKLPEETVDEDVEVEEVDWKIIDDNSS